MVIAPQTITRNRRATVRKSKAFCDAYGSCLSTGTSTTDRKIIPPIQLTAASTWSQTSRTIIAAAGPLMNLFDYTLSMMIIVAPRTSTADWRLQQSREGYECTLGSLTSVCPTNPENVRLTDAIAK
jgi:hypothetical protein